MKCPYCNHAIPDESVFCMICGERIARKKREKKPPAKYPKYRVLADGSLLGQLMVNGTRETKNNIKRRSTRCAPVLPR